MRVLILLIALLPFVLLAKPVDEEDRSESPKADTLLASDVSPTTQPPTAIPTEALTRTDGEPTFEEEIARVIEGSVEEDLLSFGTSDKPEIRNEPTKEETLKQQRNDIGIAAIDWFGLMFSNNDSNAYESTKNERTTIPSFPVPPKNTKTEERPFQMPYFNPLQAVHNQQQRLMGDQHAPMEQIEPVNEEQTGGAFADRYQSSFPVPPKNTKTGERPFQMPYFNPMVHNQQQRLMGGQHAPMEQVEPVNEEQTGGAFADRYQRWMEARNLADNWMNMEPQKQDPYAAVQKNKLGWSKLLAEPVQYDYKQYLPAENTVQWSSNEIPSDIDVAQKQLSIPTSLLKNKEQWFGESEM